MLTLHYSSNDVYIFLCKHIIILGSRGVYLSKCWGIDRTAKMAKKQLPMDAKVPPCLAH